MIPVISKSDFVKYIECPRYAWLWKNKPELRKGQIRTRIMTQGDAVEKIAHGLFDKGEEVEDNYQAGADHTRKLIKEGVQVIYQATAMTDKFLARADIMVRDKDGKRWHLYEVKSSTKEKPEHHGDLAFQYNAFNEFGMEIASIHLIVVNNQYIFNKKKGIEADKFLKTIDLTEQIQLNAKNYADMMKMAHKVIIGPSEPKGSFIKKLQYNQPSAFDEYYWKGVPKFSIYDTGGIFEKELIQLSEMGIMEIDNIPDSFFKNEKKNFQVQLTKQKTSYIDKEAIQSELDGLEYPLYFLDYETIMPGIPRFDQMKPYKHIPFQYSLHVLDKPNGELKHYEYLHIENSNPMPALLASLKSQIGKKGSVLVWNKSFEMMCNRLMGEQNPEYSVFMDSINRRIYDLKDICNKYYLDYRFKGSASLKNVLPVLVPELSYENLEIQDGSIASDQIMDLIEGKATTPDKLKEDLLEYCKRDTLAMVKIFEYLKKIIT
jgi:CRISPR/Cas system-associated exonuclease Cas4 (RecB family)